MHTTFETVLFKNLDYYYYNNLAFVFVYDALFIYYYKKTVQCKNKGPLKNWFD